MGASVQPANFTFHNSTSKHLQKTEKIEFKMDKTLFIWHVMKSSTREISIVRPRHFGKTTNLKMLSQFLNKMGKKAYTTIANDTAIMTDAKKHFRDKHMNQYPVIYIDFEGVGGQTYDEAKQKIHDKITRVFQNLPPDIRKSVFKYDRTSFSKIIDGTAVELIFDIGIERLCKVLSETYWEKPVILIDNGDVPLVNAFLYGYYDEMERKLSSFYLETIKNNQYASKIVITGVLPIFESTFSNISIPTYALDDELFFENFGFIHDADSDYRNNSQIPEEVFKLCEQGEYGEKNMRYFNPGCIQKCITSPSARYNYQFLSGSHRSLVDSLLLNNGLLAPVEMQNLLYTGLSKKISLPFSFRNLKTDQMQLWALLWFTGVIQVFPDTPKKKNIERIINMPNKLIRSHCKKHVFKPLISGKQLIEYSELMDYLDKENVPRIVNVITNYIQKAGVYLPLHGGNVTVNDIEEYIKNMLSHWRDERVKKVEKISKRGNLFLKFEKRDESKPLVLGVIHGPESLKTVVDGFDVQESLKIGGEPYLIVAKYGEPVWKYINTLEI